MHSILKYISSAGYLEIHIHIISFGRNKCYSLIESFEENCYSESTLEKKIELELCKFCGHLLCELNVILSHNQSLLSQ